MNIDMKKVEENKEEIKENIKSLEKSILKLAESENPKDKEVAKLLNSELNLFRALVGEEAKEVGDIDAV